MHLLFQDNHILVAVKPANLLTQEDDTKRDNFTDLLKEKLKKDLQKERIFLHPVHRLDKAVSGIVLFARSSKALSRLNEQQRERKMEKTYFALVEGRIDKERGELEDSLIHTRFKAKFSPKGKKAFLAYEVVGKKRNTTLIKISLLTGRYHQIRAQLSFFHHPIVGDAKYGSSKKRGRICLHHAEIAFFHPVTKERLFFSDYSADFLKGESFHCITPVPDQ